MNNFTTKCIQNIQDKQQNNESATVLLIHTAVLFILPNPNNIIIL